MTGITKIDHGSWYSGRCTSTIKCTVPASKSNQKSLEIPPAISAVQKRDDTGILAVFASPSDFVLCH